MGDAFNKQLPLDNVYLIKTADDLPQELSQWTLYNLQYDPGDGVGLYFSPDGSALVRLAAGGGGGGVTVEDEGVPLATIADTLNFVGAGVTATGGGLTKTITIPGGGGGGVTSFNSRVGIVVPLIADYAGLYVDSFNTRTGVVVPLVADYAGLYVDSFIGRTGAVVAVDADYASFYLQKALVADQLVIGDVEFSGTVEMTNIFGFKLGPSCELELRNSGDDTTFFVQYSTGNVNMGLAGSGFNNDFMNFGSSFTHFRFGDPIMLSEKAAPVAPSSSRGQIWVRNDDPNILMFTDGDGDDFIVDVTPA